MKSTNATLVKEQVMSEVSSDLAETEIEKFKSLIEDVDFQTKNLIVKTCYIEGKLFPSTKLSQKLLKQLMM